MFGIITLILATIIELALIIKRKSIRTIFIAVCVEAVVLVVYSILTYGQTAIHSDVATPIILIQSMVRNHSLFPETFNYANGDIWFLAPQLFCFLPSLFIKSQSLVRMLASAQFVLVAIGGIIFSSKRLFKDNSWDLIVPIIFLLMSGERSMLIYEAGYISLVLWLTLIPSLFYIVTNGRYKIGIVYCLLLTALVSAAPMRYAAEIILPLLLAYLYIEFIDSRKLELNVKIFFESAKKVIILLVIPTIVGKFIYDWLCSWHNVNLTVNNSTVFVGSIQQVWQNIQLAALNLYSIFGYSGGCELVSLHGISNLISIFMCTLLCFVVPYLQGKCINKESKAVKFFYIFSMSHNSVLIMTCVFFGQVAVARYLLTTVVLFVIISARYIYCYWLNDKALGKFLLGGFVFCVLIEGSLISTNSFGWKQTLSQKKELARVLEENNLKKGYATYWNAYNNQVYADSKIEFGAINLGPDGTHPYYWLVDSDVFLPEKESTFLLLTSQEHDSLEFNIIKTFGAPVKEINCGDYYVIVFDHDIILNMR